MWILKKLFTKYIWLLWMVWVFSLNWEIHNTGLKLCGEKLRQESQSVHLIFKSDIFQAQAFFLTNYPSVSWFILKTLYPYDMSHHFIGRFKFNSSYLHDLFTVGFFISQTKNGSFSLYHRWVVNTHFKISFKYRILKGTFGFLNLVLFSNSSVLL